MKRKSKRERKEASRQRKETKKFVLFNGLVIVVRSFSTLYDIEKLAPERRIL